MQALIERDIMVRDPDSITLLHCDALEKISKRYYWITVNLWYFIMFTLLFVATLTDLLTKFSWAGEFGSTQLSKAIYPDSAFIDVVYFSDIFKKFYLLYFLHRYFYHSSINEEGFLIQRLKSLNSSSSFRSSLPLILGLFYFTAGFSYFVNTRQAIKPISHQIYKLNERLF